MAAAYANMSIDGQITLLKSIHLHILTWQQIQECAEKEVVEDLVSRGRETGDVWDICGRVCIILGHQNSIGISKSKAIKFISHTEKYLKGKVQELETLRTKQRLERKFINDAKAVSERLTRKPEEDNDDDLQIIGGTSLKRERSETPVDTIHGQIVNSYKKLKIFEESVVRSKTNSEQNKA